MDINQDEFIWEEKYSPKSVEECILPIVLKKKAIKIVQDGQFQNMLFYSGPGTGKTTLAKALCIQLDLDYILINGSKEGRLIDTVRNLVDKFANTSSIFGGSDVKVVIYDEFDNAGEVQMAIRGLVSEVSAGCRFIFTGNYIQRIIEPIRSRTTNVDFSIPAKEKPQIMNEMMKRLRQILEIEGIKYDKNVLAAFIKKMFPDFRRVLNEMQAYSATGMIDEGILEITTTRYEALVEHVINRDFKGCIKWTNSNTYDASIYSQIARSLQGRVEGLKWIEVITQANEYQYKHAFVVDPDINLWAFCTTIMELV